MSLVTAHNARMYKFCLVCSSVCPSGSGVCPGIFAHLTDFVQLLITFKHCMGMLTKKHTHTHHLPIPPPSPPAVAAGCAIQPCADSSYSEHCLVFSYCQSVSHMLLCSVVSLYWIQQSYRHSAYKQFLESGLMIIFLHETVTTCCHWG